MAHKKGLSVDPRVNIAMDALTSGQRESVSEADPGPGAFLGTCPPNGTQSETIDWNDPLSNKGWIVRTAVIYSIDGDTVSVLDLMNGRTMDRLGPKKKKKKKKKRGLPRDSSSHSVVE